ncbi:SEL1-like repeat protein [Acetobacteraceae bacterium]|nr:SEL1-like repeat protein [Acetobacteraceae bacterium]
MKHKQRSLKILWILPLCFLYQGIAGVAHAIDPAQIDDFVQRADHGDMQAEYVLGISFLKGDGIVQNDFLAKQYLKLAAAQGHQEAQIQLDKIAGKAKPMIPLKPNFDHTLPPQPKIGQNIKKASPVKAAPSKHERKVPHMFLILELILGGTFFLFGFQMLYRVYRFVFPKKQTQSKLGTQKSSYQIISDFKGRL